MLAGNSQLRNTMGGIENDALSDDLCCRFLRITFRFPIGCSLCLLATRSFVNDFHISGKKTCVIIIQLRQEVVFPNES